MTTRNGRWLNVSRPTRSGRSCLTGSWSGHTLGRWGD